MSIIASIYVYNFHIIISYLGGGVRIVPFKDNRDKYRHSKAIYSEEISHNTALMELQAKRHILFGTENSKLTSYDLRFPSVPIFQKSKIVGIPLTEMSQLSINYQSNNLYALSEGKGIFEINISNPQNTKINSKIIPKVFEMFSDPVVSNMEASFDDLLLSIRNYGVCNINISTTKHYERKEIRTEDPQDVKKVARYNIIAVADSEDGLLLFNFTQNKPMKQIKLPNNDFPQQIELVGSVIVLKGAQGLYAYHFNQSECVVLREGKIGALASYYDYIFFSSKGKLFSLLLNNSFERHGFLINHNKIDLELLKSPS
jgi:hypothetical protein